MPFIEAENVVFGYGPIPVLKSVSFTVDEGAVFAIIGPNGAGKTTLFRTLTGESIPQSGRIAFRGKDVTRSPAHQRARDGFGRTFQVARIFAEFTAIENVVVAIESRNRSRSVSSGSVWRVRPAPPVVAEAQRYLDELELGSKKAVEARFLSHGDKKRLELAMTMATGPKVLMLDEPTAGMSPSDRVAATGLLKRVIRDNGLTVLLTEHDMDMVFALADRIMVLNYGEVIALGKPGDVRHDPAVKQVYLGEELEVA